MLMSSSWLAIPIPESAFFWPLDPQFFFTPVSHFLAPGSAFFYPGFALFGLFIPFFILWSALLVLWIRKFLLAPGSLFVGPSGTAFSRRKKLQYVYFQIDNIQWWGSGTFLTGFRILPLTIYTLAKIANIPSKQSSISEIANLFRCLKYIIKSIKKFRIFLSLYQMKVGSGSSSFWEGIPDPMKKIRILTTV